MKYFKFLTVNVLSILLMTCAYGQEPDSVISAHQVGFYQKLLKIDEKKARKVAVIQNQYKAGLRKITDKNDIPDEEKARQIKILMSLKNSTLKKFLTADEQKIIIPTTEWKN